MGDRMEGDGMRQICTMESPSGRVGHGGAR